MRSKCRAEVNADRMQSVYRADAERMQSESRASAEWMLRAIAERNRMERSANIHIASPCSGGALGGLKS